VGTIPFDALGAPGWKPRPGAGSTAASGADGGHNAITEGRSHAG
jgi:hypothetical protein